MGRPSAASPLRRHHLMKLRHGKRHELKSTTVIGVQQQRDKSTQLVHSASASPLPPYRIESALLSIWVDGGSEYTVN
jgi:hypothetical protein